MRSDPLVSCVIPVLNAERFLAEALESIFSQTYPHIEVVAVDSSTDGSTAVLARYGSRVSRLPQPQRGEAAARNAGVAHAQGDLIAFLDADDLWEPGKIARQIARLDEDPTIDLSFTSFQNFWMPEVEQEGRLFSDHSLARPSSSWSICTLLTRRTVLERHGPFDERLRSLPNMTWFVRAAREGARIDVLPDVLMRRRLHSANATRAHNALDPDEFLPMLKAWRDLRQKSGTS